MRYGEYFFLNDVDLILKRNSLNLWTLLENKTNYTHAHFGTLHVVL